jgi:hypothetical protein
MGMEAIHIFVRADQTTQREVVDGLIDFWTDRGATLVGRGVRDLDYRALDEEGRLAYAVSPPHEGWMSVTDSSIERMVHGVARGLTEGLEADTLVKWYSDTGQALDKRLYRADARPVPEDPTAEFAEYLWSPQAFAGADHDYDPRDEGGEAAPAWMKPYLDELEQMRRELDALELDEPEAGTPRTYRHLKRKPDEAEEGTDFLIFEDVDSEVVEELTPGYRRFRWGNIARDDVREQFDDPREVPVDAPDRMRQQGFLPVEPPDTVDGEVTVLTYSEAYGGWLLVSVRDGKVRDSRAVAREVDGLEGTDLMPHYASSDHILAAWMSCTDGEAAEAEEGGAVRYFFEG